MNTITAIIFQMPDTVPSMLPNIIFAKVLESMWYHTYVTWIFGFHSSLILFFIFLSNHPRMGESGYGSSVLITQMLLSYMTLVLISDLTAFSTTFVLRTLVSMGMVSSAISSYKFPLLSSPVSAQVACVAIHRFFLSSLNFQSVWV